jgi:hypothetical protein
MTRNGVLYKWHEPTAAHGKTPMGIWISIALAAALVVAGFLRHDFAIFVVLAGVVLAQLCIYFGVGRMPTTYTLEAEGLRRVDSLKRTFVRWTDIAWYHLTPHPEFKQVSMLAFSTVPGINSDSMHVWLVDLDMVDQKRLGNTLEEFLPLKLREP